MTEILNHSAEPVRHVPVLPAETLEALSPRAGGRYLDGTLGMGGHASAVLGTADDIELCGLDRDEDAMALAKQRLAVFGSRAHFFHCNYSDFSGPLAELGWDKIDGALLDIGVSSLQLDEAGRIARVIVEARQKASIDTTAELAALVEKAYPAAWRAKARRHPATRTFQALRMAVNDELGELRRFLDAILGYLPIGGRLAVITFHSLEDRMVKQTMRHWAEGCRCPRHVPVCVCHHQPEVRILFKKPVTATPEELAVNPRSSSAKLRAVEKIAEATGS